MTTKLRVLLDEDISGVVASSVADYSGLLSVKYVCDMPGFKGTDDPPLLKYADEENRVLITVDTGFNHRNYPPCTRKGIIRVEVKNCVAYVSDGQAIIHTHDGTTTIRF